MNGTRTEAQPSFDVCIDVLGPIQIEGTHHGAEVRPRAKSKEMVALLALHRPGYTAAELKTLLWPGRPPSDLTFHKTVSAARAWLSRVEGENLIPRRTAGGQVSDPFLVRGFEVGELWGEFARVPYLLEPCVGTTWDLFQWQVDNARGPDTADRLNDALALVRGEPLAGDGDLTWAVADMMEMTDAIGDAAHLLAQLRLEAGDVEGAAEAARRGLRGSPWAQRLYGDLILAAHEGGDPAGMIDVWNELRARLEDDDEINLEVRAIYDRCTNGPAR